jgi:hypothetical protein
LIAKPYNFNAAQIGLFHLGGFTGTLLATLTAPPLIDWLIVRLAKRNEGIFEPEMRLWMMFPAAAINSAGLMLSGIGLAKVCSITIVPADENLEKVLIYLV